MYLGGVNPKLGECSSVCANVWVIAQHPLAGGCLCYAIFRVPFFCTQTRALTHLTTTCCILLADSKQNTPEKRMPAPASGHFTSAKPGTFRHTNTYTHTHKCTLIYTHSIGLNLINTEARKICCKHARERRLNDVRPKRILRRQALAVMMDDGPRRSRSRGSSRRACDARAARVRYETERACD